MAEVFDIPLPGQTQAPNSVAWNIELSLPTLPQQRFSTETSIMNSLKDNLVQAVELALAAKWDAAHELVQQYEDDATAAWIRNLLR